MGNCFGLNKKNNPSLSSSSDHTKILTVVKTDGKILEYTKCRLVKEILMNFSDNYGICLSRNKYPLQVLPLDYNLKLGNVYYLVPESDFQDANSDTINSSRSKRIKVIMTKDELRKLVSNKISAEEICLLGVIQSDNSDVDDDENSSDSSSRWRPVLEAIPEECCE